MLAGSLESNFNHAKHILDHVEAAADQSFESGRVNGRVHRCDRCWSEACCHARHTADAVESCFCRTRGDGPRVFFTEFAFLWERDLLNGDVRHDLETIFGQCCVFISVLVCTATKWPGHHNSSSKGVLSRAPPSEDIKRPLTQLRYLGLRGFRRLYLRTRRGCTFAHLRQYQQFQLHSRYHRHCQR